MIRWLLTFLLGTVLAGALAAAYASTAEARPGGGHSYSGGGGGGSYRSSSSSSSRSSSSGGGHTMSSDEAAVVAAIGLGFVIFLIVISVTGSKDATTSWTSRVARPISRAEIAPLVQRDPAFSQTAFEDFAFQLYARAHRARGAPAALAALTPYLGRSVLEKLQTMPPVHAVVIGSLRVITVAPTDDHGTVIEVRVEANHAGPQGTVNVVERCKFWRASGAKTRAPDKTRTFPCPACNAPFTVGQAPDRCAHCGEVVPPGRFDWALVGLGTVASTSVGMTLTGTVAEVGNELPTLSEPEAHKQFYDLHLADPNVSWDTFAARFGLIYRQLNTAWNAQDLTSVRGLVTSSLLGYLQFWIDEYKRQRLANRLDDAKYHRLALAKVQRDPYFDAVTVRVFADGNDYTLDATGKVVGGSQTTRRAYTEYWTLIRSSARRGPITTELTCPNCGAPLAISDAGACTYCNAEVESGSFDWVLSKIEQDEVYRG